LAFGDQDGTVHLMSGSIPAEGEEPVPFNGFEGHPIEWADISAPLPEVDWEPNT
jgi:PAB-dependent poly(A)-specific ribonuclease subunit 2